MEEANVHDDIIIELLKEFNTHRLEINKMINELEDIRSKVDTLIPTSLDARFIRFFEEKIKSITGLFNSLLDMRKEIAKSIKDEIDIRRRLTTSDKMIDIEDMLDVRKMVGKIDEFKKVKDKIQEKRVFEAQNQEIEEGIDIPGLSDEAGIGIGGTIDG